MQGRISRAVFLGLVVMLLGPRVAHAGGPEFPGGGTRSLGRGAAAFARADDPSVMIRNPALLADMWDDMALIGAHFLIVDACMQPTGAFGWDAFGGTEAVADYGDGPILLEPEEGATDLNGKPLVGYADEPYPEVCYQGPMPFLPQVGLSMKLTDDFGVGLGFFPPDNASLSQWGNRDGTIDTPNGKRPNPLRFFRSHLNTSFFTLLGAAGYRLAPWISIGAGFQWNVVAYSSTSWSTPQATPRPPTSDIKANVFGRDLFIPGFVASMNLKPFEALDISLGFRWSDRISSKAKLDLTTGAFGTGEIYQYKDEDGEIVEVGSAIPFTTNNQAGVVSSPPIWVPQLSFGLRFADRLKPIPRDYKLAHQFQKAVEDSMLTERWDLEIDAVYYFTSTYDHTTLTNDSDTRVSLLFLQPGAPGAPPNVSTTPGSAGMCRMRDPATNNCIGDRVTETRYGGENQFSIRVGGDYNILPGLLALRAGASYETSGQTKELLNVLYYLLPRIGIHAGLTLRVAKKTDISLGFAHFIQEEVNLQVNPMSAYPDQYKSLKYNFRPGLGVEASQVALPASAGPVATSPGNFDGIAMTDIPNSDNVRTEPGPAFVNGGSFFYHLDVVSVSFAQHF